MVHILPPLLLGGFTAFSSASLSPAAPSIRQTPVALLRSHSRLVYLGVSTGQEIQAHGQVSLFPFSLPLGTPPACFRFLL